MSSPRESSSSLTELETYEQRLQVLQRQVADLKELAQLEQVSPEQWAELQEQITALEDRMSTYLEDLTNTPMIFWQVIRFGGAGFLLGVVLARWVWG